jgi:hypothetical protein
MEELKKAGKLKPEDFNGELARSHAADYTRVARAAIEAITKHDPQRLVVTDGYNGGTAPIPVLLGTAVPAELPYLPSSTPDAPPVRVGAWSSIIWQ